jgi:hypothetical protein
MTGSIRASALFRQKLERLLRVLKEVSKKSGPEVKLTVKAELARDVKDFWNVFEVGSKALNQATIEPHTGFDEIQIQLLSNSTFNMFLLAICFPEFGEIGSKFRVHPHMRIPEASFNAPRCCHAPVEEHEITAGISKSTLAISYCLLAQTRKQTWLAGFLDL